MTVAALILAAGQASRFGRDKRQALLPDGRSLLDAVLATYAQAFPTLLLVIRPQDAFAPALAARHGARVVWAPDADQGMGQSLAHGAQALLAMPDVEAVVVGLADMPFVTLPTLLALQSALATQAQPVLPVCQGQWGQPRGLPRRYFEAMATLTGDQGARHVLDWAQQAQHLPVSDPGVLTDIDHPQDLAGGTL